MVLSENVKNDLIKAGYPDLQRGWDAHEMFKLLPVEIYVSNSEGVSVQHNLSVEWCGDEWWVRYTPLSTDKNPTKVQRTLKDGWNGTLLDSLAKALIVYSKIHGTARKSSGSYILHNRSNSDDMGRVQSK